MSTKFTVHVPERFPRNYPQALLFSGGMDSTLVFLELTPDEAHDIIYVNMYAPDSPVGIYEKSCVKAWEKWSKKNLRYSKCKFHYVDLNLSEFELPNKIIPQRNVILAAIGYQFNPRVEFGFTKGDTTRDKSAEFLDLMTAVQVRCLDVPLKNPNRWKDEIIPSVSGVTSSTLDMTKDNVAYATIQMLKVLGIDVEWYLRNTTSCYDPVRVPAIAGGHRDCGKCTSCFRKYTAFLETIGRKTLLDYFEQDPTTAWEAHYGDALNKGRHITELRSMWNARKK